MRTMRSGSAPEKWRTEGGEALSETFTTVEPLGANGQRWHVLWTRSNCEQLVCDQLTSKGFDVFLPRIGTWSRRGAHRRLTQVPMFPGYAFVHHAMDRTSYLEVSKAKGLVSILGERWDRLEAVPDAEVGAIQQAFKATEAIFPHAYLREGQRVRIVHGPMAGVEGIFLHGNAKKGLLVISINMLRRSVATEVDCTLVAAA
jgi:transcriptional antiterminator NusG